MSLRKKVGAATLVAAAASVVLVAQPPQGPTFKSGTQVVSLFVMVADAQKRLVPDLMQEEFQVFETTGRITFAALETDRDYHLALEDPAAPQFTIVIELADTDCQGAVLSPHLTTLASAKGLFLMLLRLTGRRD